MLFAKGIKNSNNKMSSQSNQEDKKETGAAESKKDLTDSIAPICWQAKPNINGTIKNASITIH